MNRGQRSLWKIAFKLNLTWWHFKAALILADQHGLEFAENYLRGASVIAAREKEPRG